MTTETEATSQSLQRAAIVLSRPGDCRWLTLELKSSAGSETRIIRDSMVVDASEVPGQGVSIRLITGEVLNVALSLKALKAMLED